MNALFDYLDLQPSERRLVLIMMVVLFAFVNLWFVFPYFQESKNVGLDILDNQDQLMGYQLETNRIPDLELRLQTLEGRMGTNILADLSATQRVDFQRNVDRIQRETGMEIGTRSPITETLQIGGNTNRFFTELSMNVNYTAREENLVNFMYNISSGDSRIRVSDVTILPMPNQRSLKGRITLVSSFRRESGDSAE